MAVVTAGLNITFCRKQARAFPLLAVQCLSHTGFCFFFVIVVVSTHCIYIGFLIQFLKV